MKNKTNTIMNKKPKTTPKKKTMPLNNFTTKERTVRSKSGKTVSGSAPRNNFTTKVRTVRKKK